MANKKADGETRENRQIVDGIVGSRSVTASDLRTATENSQSIAAVDGLTRNFAWHVEIGAGMTSWLTATLTRKTMSRCGSRRIAPR